jgi:outer membrane protein assembly factor BamB
VGNGLIGAAPAADVTIRSDDLPPGTRFILAGVDNGTASDKVRRYASSGSFFDAWPSPNLNRATGSCFSPNGNVLSTTFDGVAPILFSRDGAVRKTRFGVAPQALTNHTDESCVFNAAGEAYVGVADGAIKLFKFDANGRVLETFSNIPVGARGVDWIDLSSNQCTLFYTSEDTKVRRYDVCARAPLPDFATGLAAPCYALRLRPNSEVMVACRDQVYRLSVQGTVLQNYTRQSIGETSASGLFALNLDPDGSSFWTAGLGSGKLYRVDIATGALLHTFAGGAGSIAGLSVYDELSESSPFLFRDSFE